MVWLYKLSDSALAHSKNRTILNTNSHSVQKSISLEPNNAHQLAHLNGQFDSHLKQIESRLNVVISNRGNRYTAEGFETQVEACLVLLKHLYQEAGNGETISDDYIHLCLQESDLAELQLADTGHSAASSDNIAPITSIRTRKMLVKPRGNTQKQYVTQARLNDINFGVGPAGTGKTYLAVALAVEALEKELVQRILLVRPAVEAGEKLGFLPGDLNQKVDPYLRPLYDALYEMLGFEKVEKMIERHIIEIAPLAYMRGRTLNNSFIILDESQNTTREQMKMFLTRIGFGSTAVITGDVTQVDLPNHVKSGLKHAIKVLDGVDGISFSHFSSKDVVRHPIVQRIVEAYEDFEQNNSDT